MYARFKGGGGFSLNAARHVWRPRKRSCNAALVGAETVTMDGPSISGSADSRGVSDAASKITCALVPPNPKLLTPALGIPTRFGHGCNADATRRAMLSNGIRGFGSE